MFWAVCGAIGCMISMGIYVWQAWCAWLEKDDY
jgi:hypothetical protein